MQFSSIARLGAHNQSIIDEWFAIAITDPTVGPYIGVSDYHPLIKIPDSDWDGFVLIDEEHQGVIKVYFDRETMTASMGVWVLAQDSPIAKSRITASLVMEMANVMQMYKRFTHMSARVAQDNIPSVRMTTSILGEPWGTEPYGSYCVNSGEYIGMLHFKSTIADMSERFYRRFPHMLSKLY